MADVRLAIAWFRAPAGKVQPIERAGDLAGRPAGRVGRHVAAEQIHGVGPVADPPDLVAATVPELVHAGRKASVIRGSERAVRAWADHPLTRPEDVAPARRSVHLDCALGHPPSLGRSEGIRDTGKLASRTRLG